jgi:hypothetical protein
VWALELYNAASSFPRTKVNLFIGFRAYDAIEFLETRLASGSDDGFDATCGHFGGAPDRRPAVASGAGRLNLSPRINLPQLGGKQQRAQALFAGAAFEYLRAAVFDHKHP